MALKVNNVIVDSEAEVANIFNMLFYKYTSNLDSSPTTAATTLLMRCAPKCCASFQFKYVSAAEIFKNFYTYDMWGISVRVIKSILISIASYLGCIFNSCTDNRLFQDLLMFSKVIPMLKSGDKGDQFQFYQLLVTSLKKLFLIN